jgi:hypothetical protein
MRNAGVINAISAKIAAHVSEISGQPVTPITTDDITHPWSPEIFRPYWLAIRVGAEAGTLNKTAYAEADEDLGRAYDYLMFYIRASAVDIANVIVPDDTEAFDLPEGAHPTPEEWQAAAEDWEYGLIPARYLPDGEDGPRTDEGREEARIALWRVWATKSLGEWARANAERDAIVRAAYAAGVPKTTIHKETGIARTTIDRIIS